MCASPLGFVLVVLRGVAQIMLQRNAATGALFLLALAINSITVALATLLGSLIGTVVARLGGFPRGEIEDGLHGFNPALVAIATVHFYALSAAAIVLGLFGIVFAGLLMRVMQAHSLKPYTFPFVLSVWLMFWVLAPDRSGEAGFAFGGPMVVDAFFQAFAQVMFQANSLTGLIFLVGIMLGSWRCACFAMLGVAMAIAIGFALGWPGGQIAAGVHGYNAVLAAIALALGSRHVLYLLLGIVLSVVITKAMLVAALPALTFPFILSTWVALAVQRQFSGEAGPVKARRD